MRLYIASSTDNVEKVEHLIQWIKTQTDHTITFDWTESYRAAGSNRESVEMSEERVERAAAADMAGVASCDLFILLWHPNVYGAMAEFGMAMMLNKTAWVVSDNPVKYSVFFRCPGNHVTFYDVSEAYKQLREVKVMRDSNELDRLVRIHGPACPDPECRHKHCFRVRKLRAELTA